MDIPLPDRRSPIRRLAAPALATIVIVTAIWWFARGNDATATQGLLLDTVRLGALRWETRAIGSLKSEAPRSLTAHAAGRVLSVDARAGQRLIKGDLVLRLDSEDLRQRLAGAEAELAAARIDHDLAQSEQLAEASERTLARMRAQAAVIRAATELDAQRELAEKGVSSRLVLQRAEVDHRLAEQELALLQDIEAGRERAAVLRASALQARLRGLEAQTQSLRDAVSRLEVRVERDALLLSVTPRPGGSVVIGDILAELAETDALIAEIGFPEAEARRMRAGAPARLRLDGMELDGAVLDLAPPGEDGLARVRIGATQWPAQAQINATVEAIVLLEDRPETRILRRPTLLRQGTTQAALFRLARGADHAVAVDIEFGLITPTEVEILRGAEAGDRFIVDRLPKAAGERLPLD
ncbi:MAG: HlyD family efflux transporter periplasmic adaptor subunit [Xanthomonadales bacterium]|jgi:multidrug efflux pump subunit AcrA (membrane-fusion protein)|nr:HlyD family efflux transporter periplasmic adaptor subunit [Xanthomonadales bacterium]